MQKKRLLLIGGSTLAITLAGLLIIPSFIDWSKYQTLATTKIAEATGYDVTIGKDFKVGLLPRPHLSAKQIVVTKKTDRPVAAMASLDSIEVSIALLPLITGRVDISSITLDTPNIQLITYKDGKDNWKPKLKEKPANDQAEASNDAEEGGMPDIVIGALNIKNGTFRYADDTTGTKHTVTIPKLKLKSDALTGPFEADGIIGLNNALFNVEITTGGYREGQSVPVSADITDTKSRAALKWNGVVTTGDDFSVQGEASVKFTDLGAVLSEAGIDASVPSLPAVQLSGMLTASPNKASLTNGSLQLDKTRFATAFDWQKSNDDQTLKLTAETAEFINLDEWLKKLPAPAAAADKSAPAAAPDKKTASALVPNIDLPANMSGSVLLRAGGIQYKGQKTGALTLETSIPKGSKRADTSLILAGAPGNADINLSATYGAGKLSGKLIATAPSLKETLVNWLGVVDAKTLDAPGMPSHASTELSFTAAGNTLVMDIDRMALGQTSLSGNLRYANTTARPKLTINANANLFNLPAPAPSSTPAAPAAASTAKSGKPFAITAPALPFDLAFDVKLGRFARGNDVLTDIAAAGEYTGKSLSLKNAQATTKGGTLSVSGRVTDIEALSGIDITAAVRTSDLEGFYKALTATDLPIAQKIGAFNAEAKAKGNSQKLDVDLNANARGFTIGAKGVLDDPFNPGIPSGLSVSIRHNDYIQAIRTFAPDFGSGSGAPLSLRGDLAIKDKIYELNNIVGSMGKSDMKGSLRADMSGAKPNLKADLNSNNLDLGSFVGVDAKAPSTGGSAGVQTINANSASRWSNAPLDTSALHAMNVDVSLKAVKLTYGTWELDSTQIAAKLDNGNLRLSPISANIYGGAFSGDVTASAPKDSKTMSVTFKATGKDADIGKFLSALTSSASKKADGKGAFDVSIQTSGGSASALITGANGKADVTANNLTVYGMDLDKLAANLVEAFDGGWKGVLASIPQDGLATGSTKFKDVTHSFPIKSGVLGVDKFQLETTSSNAKMDANGNVNFPAWTMDINAQVQVTQPKDVPVLGVRLSGPLNNPSKNINSTAMDNLLRDKVGSQVQKLIDKNIKDENLRGIVGGVLGIQPKAQEQAAPTQQQPPQQQQPQKSPEQQLLEGLGGLLGGRR